ncbi:hypothetical protein DY000_02038972 [Brassica cretica]|uniref:Uncharacterized protein n=1 Tax=Brassica cretica TaxID=69181 RepID=A0ABQ7BKX6_BRACR|nr:hypothetical protein DY000_02038972 [Brassica cretica]
MPKTKTQIHSCLREEASWTRHPPLRTVFDSDDHHRQCPPFKSHASDLDPKLRLFHLCRLNLPLHRLCSDAREAQPLFIGKPARGY